MQFRFSTLILPVLFSLIGTGTLVSSSAFAAEHKIFVLIAANNQSLDSDSRELRYADNDAVKYAQLFAAAGAEISLSAVPDPEVRRQFPEASRDAAPPSYDVLKRKVSELYSKIRDAARSGAETHFVFIYSGHGGLGPNQEGYITLLDRKLTRSNFYREIVRQSPATYNHLIIDACNAYYFVNKRGDRGTKDGNFGEAVQDFLHSEELGSYPNTGVILAASGESETHEWSRWEAGIFSHELRSAFLGAGDIDGDGRVTYAEAAACVDAANAAIDLPRARLKVFYRPPAINEETPLFHTDEIAADAVVRLPKSMALKYHVEDARGVRVADLHYSGEQDITLRLLGTAPFYLRRENLEARVDSKKEILSAESLAFVPQASETKGSVELTFRRRLFEIPFGLGFFHGAVSSGAGREMKTAPFVQLSTENAEASHPADIVSATPKPALRIAAWSTVGLAVGLGVAGGITYAAAAQNYDHWKAEADTALKSSYKSTSDRQLFASRILAVTGGIAITTGAALVILDAVRRKKATRHRAFIHLTSDTSDIGVSFSF